MEILGLNASEFFAALLLLVRVSAIFVFIPLYSMRLVPVQVKAATILILTLVVLATGKAGAVAPPASHAVAMVMVLREVGLGLAIGMVANIVFVAAQFCGHVVGVQMGLGMASVMDPQFNTQVSTPAQIYYYFAMLLFLAIGGDRMMVAAFIGNLDALPLGQLQFPPALVKALAVMTGEIFSFGVRLAAPVLVALFCTTVLLGIFARSVPQMNMLMLGFSLKIIVGLTLMMLMLPKWSETFLAALGRMLQAVRGVANLVN